LTLLGILEHLFASEKRGKRPGLIKEEVDLLQGRITKSIFVRHYWSPAIKELRQRVFNALRELEDTLSP